MAITIANTLAVARVRRLLPVSVGMTLFFGFFGFMGASHGMYSYASGMVIFAVVTSVVLATAIWINAVRLSAATAERRREREWFRLTLESIGDGVIATDRHGNVVFMNRMAEEMTGWVFADAEGINFGELFRIITEATRSFMESPVVRALSSGQVSGLAIHTVLIAKDGKELPIDHSAAPIKSDRGETTGVVLVFRDVSERKRAEELIRASEERYRMLFNSMDEGFCEIEVLDDEASRPADYRLLEVNPAFERHTGLRAASGRRMREMVPDLESRWFETYRRVAATGQAVRFVDETKALEGRWFDVNAFRLGHRDERKVAILFRDITFAKRAEQERENLVMQLREEHQRKDEFLAMLAHELRNPLAAIGNAVQLTMASGLQEHVDWSMEVINRQVRHLTRLIDDLLDVSRISRGKIDLRRDLIEVASLIESAVATVSPLIEERKHQLVVAIDRGSLWVNGDQTRLEQVIVNLLNNAAKYSENGGQIRLSAFSEGSEVVITLDDKGVGILPEKLPQMFDLFVQGDRSLARSEGGLGIGLTIVKKLVELHDGNITAQSEGIGKGSLFTIRLPAAMKPTPATANLPQPSPRWSKKLRILVVDDCVDTVIALSSFLELLGNSVAHAFSGPEAIEVARRFRPEFILLDIGLPIMSGFEVAATLKQDCDCKDATIIAISGYGQDEDRRRAKEAGFDHHLIKPLNHAELMALLSDQPTP